MKKNTILPILGLTLCSSLALADAQWYGKAHVAIEIDDNNTALKSNDTRLGIKGESKISESLKAIYQYEMGFDIDGSSGSPGYLSQRNQYIGLKGGFGKVIAGIHDTPVKTLEGKDLFGDTYADIGKVFDAYVDVQEREAGFVGYYAPKFGETQVSVAMMNGKGNADFGDALSIAALYGDKKLKKSSFYGGLGFDNGVDGKDTSVLRLTGGTKMGDITVRGIIENATDVASNNQARFMINGAFKMGDGTLKAQFVSADKVGAIAASDQVSLGYEIKLGKKTTTYVHVSSQDLKGTKNSYTSVGLIHKF